MNRVPEIFLSPYDHRSHEQEVYERWEQSGYFNPDTLPGSREESFTVIMPPPNANGSLHVGHALFVTLEDVMVRYNRMRGRAALWVPGADHAGFETQVVYEKELSKQGRSRFDLSHEELYEEILAFTLKNKEGMQDQIRRLGASCDWSRDTFTLDENVKQQVYATFQQLEADGLLYRGLKPVHWCPKHQTGFSDLELEYVERTDPFYYFQYGPFEIGTVRPETKFGDKYVVMHPDDKRYAQYKHGQKIEVEWINGVVEATILKDEASDPEKGSGVMTITPWHSAVDWELCKRHNLEYEQIIDERGKLLPVAGALAGVDIREAREKVVAVLKQKGLLNRIDERYSHTVPTCYKCSRDIEPQLKQQWFISMRPLAERAKEAIEREEVHFVTERYKRIALHWLEGIRDWNISRQIVWGIPIPAVVCDGCGHGKVTLSGAIPSCSACGGEMRKDTDTFDTWFSSGQWPFITLGYPDGDDFKTHYPTSVMETGHDILFFWVLRMLMLGLYRTGSVPFKTVYLHGLVRDGKGEKMSKSKGNIINPLTVSEEFGTDALRMAFLVGTVPGENVSFSLDKVRGYKKFANKVWNIARFVCTEAGDGGTEEMVTGDDLEVLSAWRALQTTLTAQMDQYQYHLASEQLYHYLWHTFADVVLEESKPLLTEAGSRSESRKALLMTIFSEAIGMLHPFMPFVTEVIWNHLPKAHTKGELLLIAQWPTHEA